MKKVGTLAKDFFSRADILLLVLCSICTIFGIVVISSATASTESLKQVYVQIIAFLLGLGLYVLFTYIDIDTLADNWPMLCVFNLAMMVLLVLFGTGDAETGNNGWIRFFGIGIQPSEVVKVVYIIVMAKHITYLKTKKDLNAIPSAFQLAFHFVVIFGLLLVTSKDLGSATVFFVIFLVMLYAAGFKWYWFVIGFACILAVLPIVWNHFLQDYQKDRLLVPYIPSIDPDNSGVNWQANLSKIALASGQLFGKGLYNGPQSQSDRPGKLIAIALRCIYVGMKSGTTLGMLVCTGVAATILFQTFENTGMCMGITPVIGITLPFFSYGGSSIVSLYAAMGIVSGIKYKRKPTRYAFY